MKSEGSDFSHSEYQRLLSLLASTLKYVQGINADPSLVKSFKQLLRYLRTLPPANIDEILGNTSSNAKRSGRGSEPPPSDEKILGMTFQQILELASNPQVPRTHLEQIATVRFGMTKGGLSILRSRDALIEKLRTLIGNESAHDSITRAAGKHRPG